LYDDRKNLEGTRMGGVVSWIQCSSFVSEKQILSLDPAGFEIDEYLPGRIEESDSTDYLDLETIIGE
jgi:hypothetical protein